ncbi:anti-sigma factor [Amycolatopsis sp., V23-08]|uniref:Regulator of SigK n=1 Tax=Amycolatopsis heterodermiae TaxID=3110235 RepID=A0ABU5RJM2_9PSEU|nr:anti-sigma factor [Amycolatopsis sp., V23-08]MEA5366488.1 anti-sigma factor [Amycolatopsis sp., V23-08]
MTTAEVHTLTGAYVLDAVTDLERADFARHLAECPTCAGEVAEFRETAAKLGAAMTADPGNRLRSRVLTEIATTRQTPPTVRSETRTPRSWRTRTAGIVAGVAAAAAVLVGGISIGSLQSEPAPAAQVAVSDAPDANVLRADGTAGGSAVVTISRQRGEALIATQNLPPLDAGHAYQVWVIGSRGAQSAGLLHAGSGILTVPLPADANRIGITTEPATGSPQPTAPAVVRVPLA